GLIEIGRLAQPSAPKRRAPAYGTVVVDTAPTGHTLRLLAAPDTVSAMANVLDALQEDHRIIRQRFAGRARPEAAARFIDLLVQQAVDTAAMLRDPQRSSFRWVTLPEMMSVAESADGIAALDAARMPVTGIMINRVIPAGDPCPLCDGRRSEERKAIAKIV